MVGSLLFNCILYQSADVTHTIIMTHFTPHGVKWVIFLMEYEMEYEMSHESFKLYPKII